MLTRNEDATDDGLGLARGYVNAIILEFIAAGLFIVAGGICIVLAIAAGWM